MKFSPAFLLLLITSRTAQSFDFAAMRNRARALRLLDSLRELYDSYDADMKKVIRYKITRMAQITKKKGTEYVHDVYDLMTEDSFGTCPAQLSDTLPCWIDPADLESCPVHISDLMQLPCLPDPVDFATCPIDTSLPLPPLPCFTDPADFATCPVHISDLAQQQYPCLPDPTDYDDEEHHIFAILGYLLGVSALGLADVMSRRNNEDDETEEAAQEAFFDCEEMVEEEQKEALVVEEPIEETATVEESAIEEAVETEVVVPAVEEEEEAAIVVPAVEEEEEEAVTVPAVEEEDDFGWETCLGQLCTPEEHHQTAAAGFRNYRIFSVKTSTVSGSKARKVGPFFHEYMNLHFRTYGDMSDLSDEEFRGFTLEFAEYVAAEINDCGRDDEKRMQKLTCASRALDEILNSPAPIESSDADEVPVDTPSPLVDEEVVAVVPTEEAAVVVASMPIEEPEEIAVAVTTEATEDASITIEEATTKSVATTVEESFTDNEESMEGPNRSMSEESEEEIDTDANNEEVKLEEEAVTVESTCEPTDEDTIDWELAASRLCTQEEFEETTAVGLLNFKAYALKAKTISKKMARKFDFVYHEYISEKFRIYGDMGHLSDEEFRAFALELAEYVAAEINDCSDEHRMDKLTRVSYVLDIVINGRPAQEAPVELNQNVEEVPPPIPEAAETASSAKSSLQVALAKSNKSSLQAALEKSNKPSNNNDNKSSSLQRALAKSSTSSTKKSSLQAALAKSL